jgi:hypothetical protein
MANRVARRRLGGEIEDVERFEVAIRPQTAPRDRRIAALAARQHGVVAHRQLIRLGLSASAIQRMVRAGRLHPIHRGVYAVGHPVLGYLGRWLGGVLACGPGAVLSHQNAAALLDLRRMSSSAVHVTVDRRTGRAPRPITEHRVRRLHRDEVTAREGIPVTSVARTLLDLAEVLPLRQLMRVLEQAERLGVFDLIAVERVLARNPGRHGMKPLRAAMVAVNGETPRVNSDWERDFLDFCDDHDIRRPELNVLVEGFLVDAFWREKKLVVELDSWTYHRFRRTFVEDRRKYSNLQLAGYLVLPLTNLDDEAAGLLTAAVAAR